MGAGGRGFLQTFVASASFERFIRGVLCGCRLGYAKVAQQPYQSSGRIDIQVFGPSQRRQ